MEDLELYLVDSLKALSFQGHCQKQENLSRALDAGIESPDMQEVVLWLAHELHILRKTDEHFADHEVFHID